MTLSVVPISEELLEKMSENSLIRSLQPFCSSMVTSFDMLTWSSIYRISGVVAAYSDSTASSTVTGCNSQRIAFGEIDTVLVVMLLISTGTA